MKIHISPRECWTCGYGYFDRETNAAEPIRECPKCDKVIAALTHEGSAITHDELLTWLKVVIDKRVRDAIDRYNQQTNARY